MDNYALGNYNQFTYKLRKLIDKVEGRKPSNYEFIGAFIDDEESLEIIKDAKNGIFSRPNAKKIFLEYLKQSKKNVWMLKNIFNTRIIDKNIKLLELEIQKDELKLIDNKREQDEQVDKIVDPVLKELYYLFIRLEKINSIEKIRLREALIETYNEYLERKKVIQAQELDDSFTLGEDNIFNLKQDMLGRATSIDLELRKIENISGENRDFNEQCQIFENAIASILGNDGENKVIGGENPPKARRP